jgi:hypothetical protein
MVVSALLAAQVLGLSLDDGRLGHIKLCCFEST